MSGETVITVVGSLGGDPELRFTPNGDAVSNFSVASTPRMFDRQANDFKDGETLWLRCNAWRDMAQNAAESLHRGDRVIVQGRLKSRSFETKEGEKRTVMELDVDEVGPSLRRASAVVTKMTPNSQNGQRQGQQQASGYQQGGYVPGYQTGSGWGESPANNNWG